MTETRIAHHDEAAARTGSEWVPEEAAQQAPPEDGAVARDWLHPDLSDRPDAGATPSTTRTNRFQRPEPAPAARQPERVQTLESKLTAEVEATQRAVGRELGRLSKIVEALSARVEALERSAAPGANGSPTRSAP